MYLIDSHAHLHFPAFSADIDEVVKRAQESDIGLVTVGTKFSLSESGVAFAECYENVWATIGLHPGHVHDHNFVDENEESNNVPTPEKTFDEERYASLVTHPKVVAIGEFGLDYSRVPEGMNLEVFKNDQQEVARQQLRFATKYQKPVVIHCRDAHGDMQTLIAEEIARGGIARRGVIHCFTGTAEDAAKYAELGFLVSITGIVTFGKSVAAAVKEIPLDQMMVETDCPYLSPIPLRGKRNEPANVRLVAQAIADLHGISLDRVAEVTTQNAVRLFGLNG
ncbi:MAG: TatD family hydrolase [Patescibacteria group bacterium]